MKGIITMTKNKQDDLFDIDEWIARMRSYPKMGDITDNQKEAIYCQIGEWLDELDQRRQENIEFYGEDGKGEGKNVEEIHRLINEIESLRQANDGEESNEECICIDMINELLGKMKLYEIKECGIFHKQKTYSKSKKK